MNKRISQSQKKRSEKEFDIYFKNEVKSRREKVLEEAKKNVEDPKDKSQIIDYLLSKF